MPRRNSSIIYRKTRGHIAEVVILKPLGAHRPDTGRHSGPCRQDWPSREKSPTANASPSPDTVLKIELVDLALPDRPRVSVSAPTGAGQVPLAFTLTFDESMILPQHDYALNAEIVAGSIRFRNVEPFRVTPLAQTEPILIVAQSLVTA